MGDTNTFKLPDLGEGLPDATVVEWFVKVGDIIRLDEPLVSMETAKAVVEVPSPVSGKVLRLAGSEGDVIETGAMLAEFEIDARLPQRSAGQDTGHRHGSAAPDPAPVAATAAATAVVAKPAESGSTAHHSIAASAAAAKPTTVELREDSGTVVGAMESSDAVRVEQASAVGGIKAMPAVRAQARKLGVDLSRVRGSGSDGVVTMADVKQAAANPHLLRSTAGSPPLPPG
ncbi:MAG: biotin/lipoyl-containing protein, partial [Luteimonas sp.]